MKIQIGTDAGSYTYAQATKTITITGLAAPLTADELLAVVHAPSGQTLYQIGVPALAYASFTPQAGGGILVLNGSVTAPGSNTDPLTIQVQVGAIAVPFKLADNVGALITSTLIQGKQRLDVSLAAGAVVGSAVPTYTDVIGGVDGSGLARQLSVDAGGRAQIVIPDTLASGSISTRNLNPTSGTATANSTVAVTGLNQIGTAAIQVTANTLSAGLTLQGTTDGTNWVGIGNVTNVATGVQTATIPAGVTGLFEISCGALAGVRVTALSAVTGSATLSLRVSVATEFTALDAPLPPGTNTIGSVTIGSAPSLVTIGGPVGTATQVVGGSDGTNAQALPIKTTWPADGDLCVPVRYAPEKKFRTTFAAAVANGVDTTFWTLIATGSGQTVNQTGGNLVITAGTTTNSETIIRSIQSFTDSYVLQYSATLSQRNANNNFFVEMVDVLGDGLPVTAGTNTATVTLAGLTTANVGQSVFIGNLGGLTGSIPGRFVIASVTGSTVVLTATGWTGTASGTCSLFGMNFHQVLYTGATATNVSYDAARAGYSSGYTTATINATTSPGHVGLLSCADGRLTYADQLRASNTGLQSTIRASRIENVPTHTVPLYVQIRSVNGTSAPTATTFTMGSLSVEDFNLVPVAISDVKPLSADAGVPVSIMGATGPVAAKASIALTTDIAMIVRPLTMTDGTNTMPTMDAVARRGFQQLTDGSNGVGVIASTAALKTDMSSIAGTVVNSNTVNGSTNRSQTVIVGGVTSNTDYSAQAWAAASGNGSVIAPADGTGAAVSLALNVSSWTAGASTGLYAYVQESPDNGTTYHDIWGFEPMTATGFARMPAIPVGGRRRMRWVNRTGAATTATVTVTAMASSAGSFPVQKQFFDWGTTGTAANSVIITNGAQTTTTSTIASALGVLNQTTAVYPMDGCKTITMYMVLTGGTVTTGPVITLQISQNGIDFATTTATVTGTAAGCFAVTYTGAAKFVRGIVTTIQAGGTPVALSYVGFQGVN